MTCELGRATHGPTRRSSVRTS